jgi:hypothetical protein
VVFAILIIIYIINSKNPQFTSECKSLNNKLNKANLYDELNNTYQITGPFQLVCGEEREYNYTDSVKV